MLRKPTVAALVAVGMRSRAHADQLIDVLVPNCDLRRFTAPVEGNQRCMRMAPVAPSEMNHQQRALHDDMRPELRSVLQGFTSEREDGALLGPFAPMIAWPSWGAGAWAATKALLEHTVLPKPAHEVAILVTGTHFRVGYELYSHERVADGTDLSKQKIATIVAGERPTDLSTQEGSAYDLASALLRGPVPDATYTAAVHAFGDEGAAELIYLVSGYCSVSMLLNGFNMPVPNADL